jgi:hypothetical protein
MIANTTAYMRDVNSSLSIGWGVEEVKWVKNSVRTYKYIYPVPSSWYSSRPHIYR